MNSKIPFVWTEVGRKPGKYVLNSIAIHKEQFPNNPRFLIMSKGYYRKKIDDYCTIIFEEDLIQSGNSQEFNRLKTNWSYKQMSYWTNTTKRFFIIENFMKNFSYEKIIHLESDCILLNIAYIEDLFTYSDWGIKYAKQDDYLGCASIFLVNKLICLQNFNSYIVDNWEKRDITDMVLLKSYLNENSDASYLSSGTKIDSKIVYDAGTIGRYYLGGESRNNRFPVSTRGLLPRTTGFFDPSPFGAIKSGSKIFLVNIENPHTKLELGCLHVHSKRIPKSYNKMIQRLVKDSNSKRGILWKFGMPDMTVVAERLVSKIYKILHINNKELRLR